MSKNFIEIKEVYEALGDIVNNPQNYTILNSEGEKATSMTAMPEQPGETETGMPEMDTLQKLSFSLIFKINE